MKIKFLGAAGTVTGSKYLLSAAGKNILIDCGIFQGDRDWKDKNWDSFETYAGLNEKEVDALLLTHAHLDHSALIPRLTRAGLKGPIFSTAATFDLCKLLLQDYAKIQEEDAEYHARKSLSRHSPPLPFYTTQDALSTLKQFKTIPFHKKIEVVPGVTATWRPMGHILGAASIEVEAEGKVVNFSGDIGRYAVPILTDPEAVPFGDLLLIESTYGDRLHPSEAPQQMLSQIITRTVERHGTVIIPSFAVGRTQLVLFYLRELKDRNQMPDVPIYVDSPMATDATEIYHNYPEYYDTESKLLFQKGNQPFTPRGLSFTQSVQESKKLNSMTEPMIIISASGMLTGGRVLHHLFHRIASPLNTVLFVGYQARGTKGAWIKSGADTARIFKQEVPIRAEIAEVSGLSAHGDRDEMLRWCSESYEKYKQKPGLVALVHGENDSRAAFSKSIVDAFSWPTTLPKYLETIDL